MPHPHTDDDLGGLGPANVAGGTAIADILLRAQAQAASQELARKGIGQSLLDQLVGIQKSPGNIVSSLQAFRAGGGTGTPISRFIRQSGGRGIQSPFGNIVTNLIRELGMFTGGLERGAPKIGSDGKLIPTKKATNVFGGVSQNPRTSTNLGGDLRRLLGF